MNEKIFSHFIVEKKLNIVRIIILCNKYNIFDTNILSRGYSTTFQGVGGYEMDRLQCKMEIPGEEWSNLKVPSVGGMDIFWNYTIIDVFSILLTASVLGLG